MDIRNPIGPYKKKEPMDENAKRLLIEELEKFPGQLKTLLASASIDKYEEKTLPGVWTVKQVVHHLADSHMNAFIRMKLALSEDVPIIKPYHEGLWAEMKDSTDVPAEESLFILSSLHRRWAVLFRSLGTEDWKREFYHPENKKKVNMEDMVGMYVWHGKNHMAHIELLFKERGWIS